MFKKIVGDLDDSLMPCQIHFSRVALQFAAWMLEVFGSYAPSLIDIQHKQQEISLAMIGEQKFRRTRFPQSFVNTYHYFCKKHGRYPTDHEEECARGIGNALFTLQRYREEGLFHGAAETLDYLAAKEGELILQTKGDMEFQTGKVDVMGLRKWFGNRVHVLEEKNKETLCRVLGECAPEDAVVFGDSPKSDIKPALEHGAYAIHIDNGLVWDYERAPLPDAHPRLVTVKTIAEVPKAYEELVARRRKYAISLLDCAASPDAPVS